MHKIRLFHGTFVDAKGGMNWNIRLWKQGDFSTAILISRGLPLIDILKCLHKIKWEAF